MSPAFFCFDSKHFRDSCRGILYFIEFRGIVALLLTIIMYSNFCSDLWSFCVTCPQTATWAVIRELVGEVVGFVAKRWKFIKLDQTNKEPIRNTKFDLSNQVSTVYYIEFRKFDIQNSFFSISISRDIGTTLPRQHRFKRALSMWANGSFVKSSHMQNNGISLA